VFGLNHPAFSIDTQRSNAFDKKSRSATKLLRGKVAAGSWHAWWLIVAGSTGGKEP
jgi:hypothetical protein